MNKKIQASQTKSINRTPVIVLWVVVILWACFIFFMSAHTGNDLEHGSGIIGWIKQHLTLAAEALFGTGTDAVSVAGHFLEYTVFGALLAGALAFTSRYRVEQRTAKALDLSKIRYIAIIGAVIIASLYGVSDEIHQVFVPGRVCDAADWLTDTLGAALGSVICAFVIAHKWRKD